MSDNSWYGEGSNFNGDLGIGFESSSVSLSQVMLSDVQQIAAGNGETYFLRKDGTVWGAGSLSVKIKGANPTVGGIAVPIVTYPNDTLKNIVEIKAGFLFGDGVPNVVALDSKGNLWGWADSTPKIIVSSVKSISLTSVLLALMNDGTVSGMGYNNYGQIGDGSMSTTGVGFSQSLGLSNIVAVANGGYHSLFLRKDGTLHLSGMTEIEVIAPGKGNGPITLSPTQVASEVVGIWTGFDGSFFKKSDGTLWCVGNPKAGMDADIVSATPRRVNF
jgi:alpha-tubulin suppressor-like RCC1 family protein